MSFQRLGGLAAGLARAGILLALLTEVNGCSDYETPILVTLVGDNPDAEAVQLTPWLGGRMGRPKTIALPTRQLVLRVPAGLGGMLRLEAEAVSSTLVGCTLGRVATEVLVEPEFSRPTTVFVELNKIERAKCPLVVERSSVRVTSDSLAINCGDSCEVELAPDTIVTLTAAMGAPHTMLIWGGDCSGLLERSCEVKMTQARRVSAQESPELRPKMIPLMPGTFQMGSPATDANRFPNEQQHTAQLTTAFALSETEVTQMQYEQLMGMNPSQYKGDPKCPVDSVSWFDAVAYCNRLSVREGLLPCYQIDGLNVTLEQNLKCRGYRLPTEAEWEYAARANSAQYQLYAGSDTVGDVAWYSTNAVMPNSPRPVRTKVPNSWGLYDLSGNVWEWVWDWYGEYPMIPLSINPIGPQSGSMRVVRGGSWGSVAQGARVAFRAGFATASRDGGVGFRLARSYP